MWVLKQPPTSFGLALICPFPQLPQHILGSQGPRACHFQEGDRARHLGQVYRIRLPLCLQLSEQGYQLEKRFFFAITANSTRHLFHFFPFQFLAEKPVEFEIMDELVESWEEFLNAIVNVNSQYYGTIMECAMSAHALKHRSRKAHTFLSPLTRRFLCSSHSAQRDMSVALKAMCDSDPELKGVLEALSASLEATLELQCQFMTKV